LELYLDQRQSDIMIGQIMIEQRAKIGDIARALWDVRMASSDVINAEDKKLYTKELTELLIESTKAVNEAVREYRKTPR